MLYMGCDFSLVVSGVEMGFISLCRELDHGDLFKRLLIGSF